MLKVGASQIGDMSPKETIEFWDEELENTLDDLGSHWVLERQDLEALQFYPSHTAHLWLYLLAETLAKFPS